MKIGETVLIHGGAGGVGSFAIQIARSAGARVLATAGPDNQETLESLGADVAIDYTRQDAAEAALEDTGGTGVDVVLDAVGGETVMNLASRPRGRSGGWQPYSGRKATHALLRIQNHLGSGSALY